MTKTRFNRRSTKLPPSAKRRVDNGTPPKVALLTELAELTQMDFEGIGGSFRKSELVHLYLWLIDEWSLPFHLIDCTREDIIEAIAEEVGVTDPRSKDFHTESWLEILRHCKQLAKETQSNRGPNRSFGD